MKGLDVNCNKNIPYQEPFCPSHLGVPLRLFVRQKHVISRVHSQPHVTQLPLRWAFGSSNFPTNTPDNTAKLGIKSEPECFFLSLPMYGRTCRWPWAWMASSRIRLSSPSSVNASISSIVAVAPAGTKNLFSIRNTVWRPHTEIDPVEAL